MIAVRRRERVSAVTEMRDAAQLIVSGRATDDERGKDPDTF
jgi:hypothetical protein